MEQIKFASKFAFKDPRDGKVEGQLWGFFEGTLADPAMVPWFGAQIRMHVEPAITSLGPTPVRALEDKDALSRALEKILIDTYETCRAEGRIVIEGVGLRSPAPVAAGPRPAVPAFTPPVPRIPPPPRTAPRVVLDVDPLNMTADGVLSPFAARDVLPFKGGKAPVAPKSALDTTAGAQMGATGMMPALTSIETLPFDDEQPDLSVEQYASLCVERAIAPEEEIETAKRYKILTEQALLSLDNRWRKRFDTDGTLRKRWQEAYTEYERWLSSRKK